MKFYATFCLLFIASVCASAATVNGLGIDYEVYDFGTYSDNLPWAVDFSHPTDPPNNNWYIPAHNYKPPVALYQLNPTLVKSQLQHMRASGIDVLVLHLDAVELTACEANGGCPTPYNDGVWGYTVDVSQSALRPQQQQNLTAILQSAVSLGFRKIFLRFDFDNGETWTSWNEAEYQKSWNFVYNTHNLASAIVSNTATLLMTDLGGEQIGLPCPANNPACQYKPWVQRLWADYVGIFGKSDTIGFSFIGDVSIVQRGIAWYGTNKPNQYAFDVYGGSSNVGTQLVNSWNSLGSEKSKPIMVMETYWNDATNSSQFSASLAANPTMIVTDLVQWPLTRTASCSGCDANIQNGPVAALNTDTQISNYKQIANAVAADNKTPSLLSVSDVNCAVTPTPCTIQARIGYQPVGLNTAWIIYIYRNNLPRVQWGCNAGSQTLTANWIDKASAYKFNYYKVASCSATPTGTPDAVSYVTFR